jgi:hypothetical protein
MIPTFRLAFGPNTQQLRTLSGAATRDLWTNLEAHDFDPNAIYKGDWSPFVSQIAEERCPLKRTCAEHQRMSAMGQFRTLSLKDFHLAPMRLPRRRVICYRGPPLDTHMLAEESCESQFVVESR